MEKFRDYLVYLIYRLFAFFVRISPVRFRNYLGRGLGKLIYLISTERREIAADNIRKALGEELDETGIQSIVRQVYRNLGFLLVEFVILETIDRKYIENNIEIKGLEILKKAFNRERGIIIYSGHFGNWEWLAAVISLLGYPVSAIAQKQHNSYFNERVNEIRQSAGVEIIKSKGMTLRKAYHKLKNGECLLILGDQDARNRGWKLNFFNRPASTYPGAVQLAKRTGALILPAFMLRESPGKHRLEFMEPRKLAGDADHLQEVELLKELTGIVEDYIRKYPEQWFWLHKRWKTY